MQIFDFRFDKINIDIDIEIESTYDCRYFSPKKVKSIPVQYLKYSHAEKLGNEIDIKKNSRFFVFVNGTFYFGDLFESIIVKNDWHVKKMTIQTLSMNQNNIDSIANLINGDYIDEFNLIISDYFYSNERNDLIRYIYEKLDNGKSDFQLAVAGTHCKICLIETYCNKFIVFHGSANLRSSSNIEQIMIEENEGLFKFIDQTNKNILQEYLTINKSIRGNKLWHQVANQAKEDQEQEEGPQQQ